MRFSSYDIERLYAVKELIRKDVSRHHPIAELGLFAGMSETRLKQGFRRMFGTGIYEYLETEKMEMAKELMADKKLSVKQISKSLGYSRQNNYSRAFKRWFGITPLEWRRNLGSILIFTSQASWLLSKIGSLAAIDTLF